MRNLLHPSSLKSALLLGILLATAPFVSAQALLTAQRGSEIAPFAQATLISPDWGQTNNLGYTVGIDYTHFIHFAVQPSLEFRYNSATGITVNERSYAGGVKLSTTIHGIHPYATILVGHGNLDLNYANGNYRGDNALIYSLGGGAEFNVTRQFLARFDFTDQYWDVDSYSLTPLTFGVGIAYRLGSHSSRVQ